MEDTQWNRILVAKGIKEAPKEWSNDKNTENCESIIEKPENNIRLLDEDQFDDEDEIALREYRMMRLQEIKSSLSKQFFGEVIEITKQDYVKEVNMAGEGVFVVLHVYKSGSILCSLINEHLKYLSTKFPNTKFIKSLASLCIANFPEENLPAIFVYCDGQLKKQLIGVSAFGTSELKLEDLEWILSQTGAIETDLESDPRVSRHKSKTFLDYGDSDSEDDY